jgi:DNA-binding NarL/FixJ family response regulator
MEVVGEAADGAGVLEQAATLTPDVVVMDISMPGMNGLVATRMLKRAQPAVFVIALTRHDEDTYLDELLRAGASGYVLKQSAPTDFIQAIRAVAAGGLYLDRAMNSRIADGLLAANPDVGREPQTPLSDRESEVLRLVAVGHSNKEIATQLGISIKTVEAHKSNSMRKLDLTGRVDVVRYAALQGWLYDA